MIILTFEGLNMDASLIALIYSVLISLFIIFGIFWGLIRGFKKTLFRGIFLVVSAVLVFGITRLVSSAFANMDITWMNINVNGVVPSNIEGLISESLKASLEEEITKRKEEIEEKRKFVEQAMLLEFKHYANVLYKRLADFAATQSNQKLEKLVQENTDLKSLVEDMQGFSSEATAPTTFPPKVVPL